MESSLAIFKTSRLTISKISTGDLDKLAPILSDESTMKYSGTGVQSKDQMLSYIQNCAIQYRENGFGHWAIFLTETNELVGLCGLNKHQVDEEECFHINYRLGSRYQGNGIATEAANGLIHYCTTSLSINNLSAIIEPSNTSSIKVIERLGFKFYKKTTFKNLNVNVYQVSI